MLRRVLRTLGIALIALPEPITTPVGIALLVTSYVLPRARGADKQKNIEKIVKTYLQTADSFDYIYSKRPDFERINHEMETRLTPELLDKISRAHFDDSAILGKLTHGSIKLGSTYADQLNEIAHNLRVATPVYTVPAMPSEVDLIQKIEQRSGFAARSLKRSELVSTASHSTPSYTWIKPGTGEKIVHHELNLNAVHRDLKTENGLTVVMPNLFFPLSAGPVVVHHSISVNTPQAKAASVPAADWTPGSQPTGPIRHHSLNIKPVQPNKEPATTSKLILNAGLSKIGDAGKIVRHALKLSIPRYSLQPANSSC